MRHAKSLALAAAVLLVSTASTSAQNLDTELIGQFASPVYATSPPGDLDRLFVVEQAGRVRIVENPRTTPTTLATPFIDISSDVSCCGERGLLGLAFHPDYATNGRFFLSFTNNAGNSRLWEYAVSATDPNVADPNLVQIIYMAGQPFSNHNGGCIQFGPDGKLYLGLGDGGSANDPGNRAQNLQDKMGNMMRFDVDIAAPFIPADNPFVGNPNALDEIWSYGLRNPWRFSFDRMTGDMYIGDVGQGQREEVSFQAATSAGGENYGWRCMEGTNCTGLSGCTCNDNALTDPITEYNHGGGRCSITGGYVYRGSEIPWLQGTYFYGDYCSRQIYTLRYDGSTVSDAQERTADLQPSAGGSIGNISSFAEDGTGELYIVTLTGGRIWRIKQDCNADTYCVSGANSSNPSGAQIGWSGSLDMGANNFSLTVGGATANEFGFFFYGGAPTQTPLGDGFICIGSSAMGFHRLLPPSQTDFLGTLVRQVDFTQPPANSGLGQLNPGTTYYFQFWYRDPNGPGGSGYNFSNGLSALFCP